MGDAVKVVTSRTNLFANETLDWSGFGPPGTDLISGSALITGSGLTVTVTQPFYGLQVRQETPPAVPDGAWSGDFLPGQAVLTNWNSPFAVILSFSRPVFGAGVQIEPGQVQGLPVEFTAFVTAFDGATVIGQFSTDGIRSLGHDGSAPFLGVEGGSAMVTSLTYRVVAYTNGPDAGDLGMNLLSIETSVPVPEPCTGLLVESGLAAIVLVGRRCTART